MKTNNYKCLVIISGAMLLGACTSSAPTWQATEMGGAVAQMIEGQIQDPQAAADPGDAAIEESDANKTKKVIDAWRESVAEANAGDGNVVINVGN